MKYKRILVHEVQNSACTRDYKNNKKIPMKTKPYTSRTQSVMRHVPTVFWTVGVCMVCLYGFGIAQITYTVVESRSVQSSVKKLKVSIAEVEAQYTETIAQIDVPHQNRVATRFLETTQTVGFAR